MAVVKGYKMKLWIYLIAISSFILCDNAYALKCKPRTFEKRKNYYDQIFIGTVRAITDNINDNNLGSNAQDIYSKITFDISRTVKGKLYDNLTVYAEIVPEMWENAFEVGNQYLVYALKKNNKIIFPACGSMLPYNFYTAHDINGDLNK